MHVLIFEKSRVGPPVGIDKAIQTEVGVMLEFSVVSAVKEDRFALRCFAAPNSVVTPFPYKAAAESGIFFRKIPVFFEIAGAVAHGVTVLHQKERFVRILFQVLGHFGKGRVHAPEQIDVGDVVSPVAAEIVSAFIVRKPRGIRLFGPSEGPLEGDAEAALVAHGPDQDAGAVAISDDHGAHSVQRGLYKGRVVRDAHVSQAHPLRVILFIKIQRRRPVALIVGFVDHIQADEVAELVKPGNIGIMAGADCVEIVGFDHAQVQKSLVHTADRAREGIGFVAVDAAESNRRSIQSQYAVFDLHFSETDLFGDDLTAGIHDQRVQIRLLGIPQARVLHGNAYLAGDIAFSKGDLPVEENPLAVRSDQGERDRQGLFGKIKGDSQVCGRKILRQIGRDDIVPDPVRGPFQNIDIPKDAGETEFVLIFQIGPVAPFEDQDGQQVFSFLKKAGHIKFRSVVRDLAVAHIAAVEPHIEAGIHAFEIQESAGRVGIPVPGEAVQIGAAGIILRDVGRVKRKRIADVCVLRAVIAPHLPAKGHRFLFPPLAGLVVRQIKKILQIMDAGIKGKAPGASAEHLQAVGALPVPYRHVIAAGGRNVISPFRQGVLVKNQEIFVESLHDQNRNLLSCCCIAFTTYTLAQSIAKKDS